MTKCLAAWTANTGASYPEYLNFSRDGDEVVVTLREAPFQGLNGNTASIRVPFAAFAAMCGQAVSEYFA